MIDSTEERHQPLQVRASDDEPLSKNLVGLRRGAKAIMFCPAGHQKFQDKLLERALSYEIEIVDWSPPPVEQ